MIDAVFFDVGGTILDETREFAAWADWLGVPRHTFSAVFGAGIAQGTDWQHAFRVFRPGFDLAADSSCGRPPARRRRSGRRTSTPTRGPAWPR